MDRSSAPCETPPAPVPGWNPAGSAALGRHATGLLQNGPAPPSICIRCYWGRLAEPCCSSRGRCHNPLPTRPLPLHCCLDGSWGSPQEARPQKSGLVHTASGESSTLHTYFDHRISLASVQNTNKVRTCF